MRMETVWGVKVFYFKLVGGHIHFSYSFLANNHSIKALSLPTCLIFFPSCFMACPSCEFAASRCPQVVPSGAARASDDVRALQWLDPGLQVSISSLSHPWFAVFNPLIPSQASPLSICSIQDQDKRLQALLNACEKLPPANNNNFKWVAVPMLCLSICSALLVWTCGSLTSGWIRLSWWELL